MNTACVHSHLHASIQEDLATARRKGKAVCTEVIKKCV